MTIPMKPFLLILLAVVFACSDVKAGAVLDEAISDDVIIPAPSPEKPILLVPVESLPLPAPTYQPGNDRCRRAEDVGALSILAPWQCRETPGGDRDQPSRDQPDPDRDPPDPDPPDPDPPGSNPPGGMGMTGVD